MVVQAQYPSTTAKATFSPEDGLNPKAPRLNGGTLSLGAGRIPSAAPKLQPAALNCAAVFSGDPGSELTCNGASGKRKRTHQYQMGILPPLQHRADGIVGDFDLGTVHGAGWGALSGGLHVPYKNSGSCDCAMASTTGGAAASSPVTQPHAQQVLILQPYPQSVDIDDLIRLQSDRLRSELEEMWKCHCRSLLSTMQQGGLRQLRQKVTELESAKRRNAELEEKVRQMAAENEMWVNVARNNEAVASSLRAGLEQVLLKNVNSASAAPAVDLEEGYGDSGSVTPATPVLEETRLCFDHGDTLRAAEERRGKQGKCRVCSEGGVSVLVLPCRHLCLCEQCEPRIAACPVCKAAVNATLRVFFG